MTFRWLSSPAVALVCFLAAVVTLGQTAAAAGRGACRVAQAAGDRRQAWLALALVVVAAAAIPVTWQPIVAEATRSGTGGVFGEIYPVMVTGFALAGALLLLVAAIDKQRAPVMAWLMIAGGFAMCAFLVVLHGGLSLPA